MLLIVTKARTRGGDPECFSKFGAMYVHKVLWRDIVEGGIGADGELRT